MFGVGWVAGLLVAGVISVGTTELFWPHNGSLAFIVGVVLGSSLPWIGAFIAEDFR